MNKNISSVLIAYLKYVALYVILIPLVIVAIQGFNFGGPFLLGFMLVVAPIISLYIPGKIITEWGIRKRVIMTLVYLGHLILAVLLQIVAIVFVSQNALNNWIFL